MGPYYRNQPVLLQECLREFVTKEVRATSHIVVPVLPFAVSIVRLHWIRPHQVAEHAIFGNFLKSVDFFYFVEGGEVRRDASVDAEEFSVEETSSGEEVEERDEPVVYVLVVLAETCIALHVHSDRKLK